MGVLSNLEPKSVFEYFETICGIPHGSGNTGGIADYLVGFAREHGLDYYRDSANNVLITKPASPGCESADTLILQAHTDMVCAKDQGIDKDFEKEGVTPVIDGEFLRADGTSLGGDDGISVAMILAILADDDIQRPKIEALLTSDEETGMIGAFAFDCSKLTGHRLINLDSEAEGVLMCSCAGGASVYSRLPVEREDAELLLVELTVDGLTGGHSGVEIDKGRANANVLMSRLLSELAQVTPLRLVKLQGGKLENAIATSCSAVVGIEPQAAGALEKAAENSAEAFKKEYASVEPGLTVKEKRLGTEKAGALTPECTARTVNFLAAIPDGVQAMSMDMPGLVQTSLNFGIVNLEEGQLCCSNSVRSSITSQKLWVAGRLKALAELAGGTAEVSGSYPGWAYNPNSVVKDLILRAYQKLFGREASVEAVHAGIECGLFADSVEGMDCVSIGPDMFDVHTPKERFSIPSVKRTYELLLAVLAEGSGDSRASE